MKLIINLVKNRKFKMISILTLLLFFYINVCAISYANIVFRDISDSVFRLHVIANSDNQVDQDLKYKVRDKVIEYMNTLITKEMDKQEVINIAQNNLEEFKQIAIKTVIEEGFNYNVETKIGNYYFPTKEYGDISLPSGLYDALRIEIGEAKGKNWWCVMFPQLCFVDVSKGIVPEDSKEELKRSIGEDGFEIISNKTSPEIKIKFKILEIFGSNSMITAKK